ncbi:MAG: hypothetical protein V4719_30040 [Planctomycetota bacterium]
MFRLRQLPRQTSRPEQPRSTLQTHPALMARRPNASHCSPSRAGRALTEVVLIVLVPCLCLMIWAMCDAELKKSLLAGPNKDNLLSVNPVYDTVNMENDTVLTVQGQGQLRFWDFKKSVMLGEMQSQLSEVRCAAYSPSERLLAVGSAMGRLEVWNLDNPQLPVMTDDPTLHEVSDCVFTADGKQLLSSGEDGQLLVWNARTLERLDTLVDPECRESIRSLGVSPDGKLAIAGTHSGLAQVWDLKQRRLLHTYRVAARHLRPDAAVESVAFVDGGANFVAATRNDGVAIWNAETGACVQKFAGDFRGLRSGVISRDGKTFVAGSEGGLVASWDVSTGKSIGSPVQRGPIIRALACSADGKMVLSGEWGGRIQFHKAAERPVSTELVLR